jgi:GNAT superfamily N-acetyltransferase
VTEIVIRRAENADLPKLIELRSEWTREQDVDVDDPGFDQRFAAWFVREAPRRVTWLAEADGTAVGMMNLTVFERMPRPGRLPSRWGYLGNAFVLAAYRNQGVGGKLIDALLDYADDNAFARVVLSPSEQSIPFYERAGFGPADALLLRTARQTATRDAITGPGT